MVDHLGFDVCIDKSHKNRLSYMPWMIVLLGLTACCAYASEASTTYIQDLNSAVGITSAEQVILRTDLSLTFLSRIFGTMGSLLMGVSQTIFGKLFYIFNIGCMALATISLSYSSMVIVVQTAGEGAALGKKLQQSYFYLIFRQLTSVMLMTPQFNGYSAIQMLLMWMVVQGVYLADVVWLKSAEYVMLTQNMAGNVLDVAASNPAMANSLNFASKDQSSQPTSSQIQAAEDTVMYIYKATLCSTFYSMAQGKPLKAISFSDMTMGTTYNSSQEVTSYTMSFPNNCGMLTVSYLDQPPDLTSKEQSSLIKGIQSSLQMTVQTVIDYVSSILPMLQGSDCLTSLQQNMNIIDLPSTCVYVCDSTPGGVGCPVSVMLLKVITQLASSVQMQSSLASMMSSADTSGAKATLASMYGVGWVGIATQYYKGVRQLTASESDSVALGYSISDYASQTTMTFPSIALAFSTPVKTMIDLLIVPPALPELPSSCDEVNDSSSSMAIWYCQALDVVSSSQKIVKKVWSWQEHTTGFDDSSTWDELYNNYNDKMKPVTHATTNWQKISPAFWPLMSTYHVSVSNVWIRTFLNPDYLKPMITDPLYTFSQMAKFLTSASITYMMNASAAVAQDMLLFGDEVMGITTAVLIPYVLIDAVLASMQQYANDEWQGCGKFSSMSYPMVPFCFILLFIPINFIIGMIVNVVVTVVRVITKILFDTVLSIMNQLIETGIVFKMRYMALIFTVSTPVLTIASYLAVYIPMLPVLMYTIAVVGWLIAVIEAMIGVPMVLLGMTSMQGHDLFGSAQQTMILLLSVFIRPVTLVIGFIFGLITLSLFGFVMAMFIVPYLGSYLDILASTGVNDVTKGVILASIMLMYLSVYATVIQLAFGAMFKIPYSIMRWIGLSGAGGEEEILDKIQSDARSQLGSMSGSFSGMQGGLSKVGSSSTSGKADVNEMGARRQGKDKE